MRKKNVMKGIEHGIRLGSAAPAEFENSGTLKGLLERFEWVYLGAEFCENLLDPGICSDVAHFQSKGKKICLLTPSLTEKGLLRLGVIFKGLLKLQRAGRIESSRLEITVNDYGALELAARENLPFRVNIGRQLCGNYFEKSKASIRVLSRLTLDSLARRGINRYEFSATGRLPKTNFSAKNSGFLKAPLRLTFYYPYLDLTTTRTCLVGMPDILPTESLKEIRCGKECRACAFEVRHSWINERLLIRGNTVFLEFPDKFYSSQKELKARHIDRLVYCPFP